MSETQKISKALIALGYSTGWVVSEAEITWIDEPATKPTKKQILDKIKELFSDEI
jgi:hypothetical protein